MLTVDRDVWARHSSGQASMMMCFSHRYGIECNEMMSGTKETGSKLKGRCAVIMIG